MHKEMKVSITYNTGQWTTMIQLGWTGMIFHSPLKPTAKQLRKITKFVRSDDFSAVFKW